MSAALPMLEALRISGLSPGWSLAVPLGPLPDEPSSLPDIMPPMAALTYVSGAVGGVGPLHRAPRSSLPPAG